MRFWLATIILALAAAQSLAAQLPASERSAPEEPDFFFLAGGPYTQLKNSSQIIWANRLFRDHSGSVPRVEASNFIGAGRFEWGFTDRFEFDLEFGYLRERERVGTLPRVSTQGPDNTMLGVRYRLLREDSAPITLTTGPQVILPSASRLKALGPGEVTYAWDVALARDFGGPFFTVGSVNVSVTPNVPNLAPGSSLRFDLTAIEWGVALGVRPLERDSSQGSHHDIHLYLELGGSRTEEIESGGRRRSDEFLAAPAIRYGFLTRRKVLAEVGLAFPVALNRAAPNWGVILQFQFEYPF